MKSVKHNTAKVRHIEIDNKAGAEVFQAIPITRGYDRGFKATRWQDYAGIGEGLVSDYLKSKKKERKQGLSKQSRSMR